MYSYLGDPPSSNPVSGPYPEVILAGRGRNALVAQTVGFGKYLGRLDVTFDMMGHLKDWTGNPILLDKTSPEGKVGSILWPLLFFLNKKESKKAKKK